MDYIQNKYITLCNKPSDITEHLPTLYKYARECDSIIELGVRGCISSWAFVFGLLSNPNKTYKKILLNDITECNIDELLCNTKNLNIKVDYSWINDLDLKINENVDLTFIDTWHVYGQLKRELDKFSKVTNKYIIMHDTTVDEIYGETIRTYNDAYGVSLCSGIPFEQIRREWNPHNQSLETGIPVEEITCGLQKAIDEFLQNNSDWILHKRYYNCNGLTILKRVA